MKQFTRRKLWTYDCITYIQQEELQGLYVKTEIDTVTS